MEKSMTALPEGFVLDDDLTTGGTVGGALPEAFVIDPTIEPIKKKEEPMSPAVKWAANRMAKDLKGVSGKIYCRDIFNKD